MLVPWPLIFFDDVLVILHGQDINRSSMMRILLYISSIYKLHFFYSKHRAYNKAWLPNSPVPSFPILKDVLKIIGGYNKDRQRYY